MDDREEGQKLKHLVHLNLTCRPTILFTETHAIDIHAYITQGHV